MSSSKHNTGELQTIKQPKNVKVLILAENKTSLKEFYHIRNCINLIKIDLSYNKLVVFPAGFTFHSFPRLRTLFLHYNKFSIIKNLMPVTQCPNLLYFTLFGNPLEQAKTRHFIVNEMPRLMLMDNKIIKMEERNPDLNIKQTEAKTVTFPLFKQKRKQQTSIYLQNVIKELAQVRRLYLMANPIIKIQRWWKHYYRLKHRKWKITKLPSESRLYTPHDIKQYKDDLQRLVTQKIEVGKMQQDKISALIKQNGQFWLYFRQLMSHDQIYVTRKYCQQNTIPFSQDRKLFIFRNFDCIKGQQISKKRQLLFFVAFHNRIIGHRYYNIKNKVIPTVNTKTKQQKCQIKINKQKVFQTDQKLQKLYATYNSYVIPNVSQSQLVTKIKEQYFDFVQASLHNEKHYSFPFLSMKLLERSFAAVTIQRYWRGAKVRKNINNSKSIKHSKAAIKIQRWIRSLKFQHRYKFLLEVNNYLKREKNSNQIILEMGQIPAIEQYCYYKQKLGKNFILNFQQCTFSIINSLNLSVSTKCKIVFHSQRNPYPNYFNLTFKSQSNKSMLQRSKEKKSNVLQILFKQALNINGFIDQKSSKMIKFTYRSQQQALNRKFILALKTYRMLNHQFIKSVNCLNFPQSNLNLTKFIDIVNENKLVSLTDEKQQQHIDNQQSKIKRISPQKSYQSLQSDINMVGPDIYLKIKFYIVTTNYSCTVVLKSPNYNPSKSQTNHQKYYIGRKRSLSKRYQPHLIESYSKISRNILSLDQFEEKKEENNKPVFYQKILNTDQSHTIIDTLSPDNSLKHIESYHKHANFDRFNKQVYPVTVHITEGESRAKIENYKRQLLRQKKELISEIKESHRQKINEIVSKKQKEMNSLRQLISKQQQDIDRKIEKARLDLQQQKLKKHKFIKDKVKFNSEHFEQQFMKKGIKSIRKDMKNIQKLCKSSRQDHASQQMHQISKSLKKQKYQSLKTQIKQFTIKFTDGDLSLKVTETGKEGQKSEQNKIFPQPIKKSMVRYQSPTQVFKSERSESLQIIKDECKDSQILNDKSEKERKKLRKKRLVHSVFPEQFYPLMQSNQIGFALPKISKM